MDDKLTLNQYLNGLKTGSLTSNKPFDNPEWEVILGTKAQTLKIPELKIESGINPQSETISKIYQLLNPVLEELESNEEFSWESNYGALSAKEIAKGYLVEAIRISLDTGKPLTYHEIGLQTIFHHVSEALVEGNKSAINIVDQVHVRNQFETMVSTLTLQCSTKEELIAYYKRENRFNMAFQANMYSSGEFKSALTEQLKFLFNQVVCFINAYQFSEGLAPTSVPVVKNEDRHIDMLNHFISLLMELSSQKNAAFTNEVLRTIKHLSTFFQEDIEIGKTEQEINENLNRLISQIRKVIGRWEQRKQSLHWNDKPDNHPENPN